MSRVFGHALRIARRRTLSIPHLTPGSATNRHVQGRCHEMRSKRNASIAHLLSLHTYSTILPSAIQGIPKAPRTHMLPLGRILTTIRDHCSVLSSCPSAYATASTPSSSTCPSLLLASAADCPASPMSIPLIPSARRVCASIYPLLFAPIASPSSLTCRTLGREARDVLSGCRILHRAGS